MNQMNEVSMVEMLYKAMSEAISKEDMETVGKIEVQVKDMYMSTEDENVKERIEELFPDMEYMAEPSEEAEEELEDVMEMKDGGRIYRYSQDTKYGTAGDIVANLNKMDALKSPQFMRKTKERPMKQGRFFNPFDRMR